MRNLMIAIAFAAVALAFLVISSSNDIDASSHREAPLISNDPLADNTDVYAFRSPDDPNSVTIVANYIPLELPEGGPNWTTFGENIRYEIHIKNKTSAGALGSATDDITYRFTFTQTNEDPTTFFNIRLGNQNLKTAYKCEKSTDGGATFTIIIPNGTVPPNNIGPRSIGGAAGVSGTYATLVTNAIATASSGEKIFCGPRDDPFFVDLGGIFDLGQTRSSYGIDPKNSANARDALAGFNCHSIIMNIPISSLQKDRKSVSQATSILDADFVIGVWASAGRPQITTLSTSGGKPSVSGPYIQVSRLGMPLTNEVIIPIGQKDYWNSVTPYSVAETSFVKYFANPELALYMRDESPYFGSAVPALSALRIQSRSYRSIVVSSYPDSGFDFRNGKDGAFAATKLGISLAGTAFAVPTGPAQAGLNTALVGVGDPRRVDVFPIFYFGVPNAIPYQLAVGKSNPLTAGKPFINNFLPITNVNGVFYGGDMLRLNMATPVTPRSTSEYKQFSYQGLIRAAAIGLTAAPYNTRATLDTIPHMDGFPNGRRLEDDVVTIGLQAVGGLVLAAVGLPFDDAKAANYSDLASPQLVKELTYNAGPTYNDVPFTTTFPYLASPHRGYDYVKQLTVAGGPGTQTGVRDDFLGLSVPRAFILEQNYPNPFNPSTQIRYVVSSKDVVRLKVYNAVGQEIATLVDKEHTPGTYTVTWDAHGVATGTYFYRLEVGNQAVDVKKALLLK